MPSKLKYFQVRYVNLFNGEFHESEMTETQLDTIELCGKMTGNSIQILDRKLIRIKNLL